MCVNTDGSVLVTAGRIIKAWSVADHSLLKVRHVVY